MCKISIDSPWADIAADFEKHGDKVYATLNEVRSSTIEDKLNMSYRTSLLFLNELLFIFQKLAKEEQAKKDPHEAGQSLATQRSPEGI